MRIVLLLFVAFLLSSFSVETLLAQDSSGAVHSWKVESKKTGEGKYELLFTASITGNWQVYAPNQSILDTKTTTLTFSDSSIEQDGDFIPEGNPKKINSPIFENTKLAVYEGELKWKTRIIIHGAVPAKLLGTQLYTYGKNDEYYPSTAISFVVPLEGGKESSTKILVASIDINNPVNNCGDEGTKNKSILSIFLLGLLGGLIALLTPCVFPMIPVTVTFFTKRSQDRKKGIINAGLYGLFIFLIYILITVPFHIADKAISPEIFNNISTNVWLNLLFFAVFVFFWVV